MNPNAKPASKHKSNQDVNKESTISLWARVLFGPLPQAVNCLELGMEDFLLLLQESRYAFK